MWVAAVAMFSVKGLHNLSRIGQYLGRFLHVLARLGPKSKHALVKACFVNCGVRAQLLQGLDPVPRQGSEWVFQDEETATAHLTSRNLHGEVDKDMLSLAPLFCHGLVPDGRQGGPR